MRQRRRARAGVVATLTAAVMAVLATAIPVTSAGAATETCGKDTKAIGFIFVGPKNDYGYNQAAYEGAMALKKEYPKLKILTAENVPENDDATRVMESMISKGAKIIFATSYGHLDPAEKVAKANPDVCVVQQGNFIKGGIAPNLGTYFGTVYEPVYLAGIAAGESTKSDKLGYVYAFPIPQTISNINAFTLGAQSVNPDVKVYTVATSNWCDPSKQADAANSLIGQGVDVITQHQDCTSTITKIANDKGVGVVGYHADASSLAPKTWITGSEWDWAPLYSDIVKTILAGDFTGSQFNDNYRVGYKTGTNPFVQSKYGKSVSADTKALIAEKLQEISTTGSPFAGPVKTQSGGTMFPAGDVPDYAAIEAANTVFVAGVVGDLPKS
ncbi:MAG: BMP family ABC transporter substrate-binding protein [Acidimicrobiia bacterium]